MSDIRTHAATPEYRIGWDRIFGAAKCMHCGLLKSEWDSTKNQFCGDGGQWVGAGGHEFESGMQHES